MNTCSAIHRRLLLATIVVVAACADAAVIDVKSSATLSGGLVRLGDVARIDDADPQLGAATCKAVTLGPAPAPGRKLRITQQAIRERLIAHGVNLTDIEFSGQSLILVEGPQDAVEKPAAKAVPAKSNPIAVRPWSPTPIQKTQAVKVVQTAFHRQFQSGASDVGPLKLTVEIPERDIALLGRTDSDIIQFVEPGLEWGGPQTLTAQFPAADGSTHVIKLQAWLNETPHIVTVKHAIPKGQLLREDDLISKPAADGETGIEYADALVGREATRPLRPGTALQHADVAKTPLVRNNDLVTVRVRTRGLTVSRVFRSNGNGAEGDVVNLVALEDPREKIQARVTAWHEAEIVSPEGERPAESRRTFPAAEEQLKFRGRK